MISYLSGTVINLQKHPNGRTMVTVRADGVGVGYEAQIPETLFSQLKQGEAVALNTEVRLQQDPGKLLMFGFSSAAERELFNLITSVSGIASQLGIKLIDTLGMQGLVEAIVTGDDRWLTKTPGVGAKGAGKIVLELKTKVGEFRKSLNLELSPQAGKTKVSSEILQEVEVVLLALGYNNAEINQGLEQAISEIGENIESFPEQHLVEELVRMTLQSLT